MFLNHQFIENNGDRGTVVSTTIVDIYLQFAQKGLFLPFIATYNDKNNWHLQGEAICSLPAQHFDINIVFRVWPKQNPDEKGSC